VVAVSVLALASFAWGTVGPVRALPSTAQRFFCYLDALGKSGQELTFWDRVTYSLVLAGERPKAPQSARAL